MCGGGGEEGGEGGGGGGVGGGGAVGGGGWVGGGGGGGGETITLTFSVPAGGHITKVVLQHIDYVKLIITVFASIISPFTAYY